MALLCRLQLIASRYTEYYGVREKLVLTTRTSPWPSDSPVLVNIRDLVYEEERVTISSFGLSRSRFLVRNISTERTESGKP